MPKLTLGAEVHRLVPKLLVPNIDCPVQNCEQSDFGQNCSQIVLYGVTVKRTHWYHGFSLLEGGLQAGYKCVKKKILKMCVPDTRR